MRLRVQSLALLSGLRIHVAVISGVGCRRGSDPALLWLWCRPAAPAPIRPLAWEPPYAVGAAQEMAKKDEKKTKTKTKTYSVSRQNAQEDFLENAIAVDFHQRWHGGGS